jgi:membrane-associated PAP2 superfamily phosphatase
VTQRGVPVSREALVALAALVLLAAWEASGLDLTVAHWYAGPAGFRWRDAWWASALLHDGGRMLGVAALLVLALGALRPRLEWQARRERLYWLGVTIVCATLVPAVKRLSVTSCPWDLAEFGGAVRYVPHWWPGASDGGPGHCFPSGHAVAAFAFFGLFFLWRPHRPALARAALLVVLAVGALFAWGQTVRGAHYPSHAMWSAWLCWAICALAAWLRNRVPDVLASVSVRVRTRGANARAVVRTQSSSSDTVAK